MTMKKARILFAQAGLGLAALLSTHGAPVFAVEAEAEAANIRVRPVETSPSGPSVDQIDQWGANDSAGAIYSPFSTPVDPAVELASAKSASHATSGPNPTDAGSAGLMATTVGAFAAVGLLAALVRFLVA